MIKKYLIWVAVFILLITFGSLNIDKKENKKTEEKSGVTSWDAETASFKKYASYDEFEKMKKEEREKELEEYNKSTNGTIVEQLQNIDIPSYLDEDEFAQLQNGEIGVRSEKSEDFPDGVLQWSASLVKDINSFTVDDFNNDGLDDVAHVIDYSGGGSGSFYELTIFINEKGKLKYLTQKNLGDRVIIKDIKYDSGLFFVDMITHGKGDDFMGYCCPNVKVTTKFQLKNNELIET